MTLSWEKIKHILCTLHRPLYVSVWIKRLKTQKTWEDLQKRKMKIALDKNGDIVDTVGIRKTTRLKVSSWSYSEDVLSICQINESGSEEFVCHIAVAHIFETYKQQKHQQEIIRRTLFEETRLPSDVIDYVLMSMC